MTVVNAESATSYMHQPKISRFVTGDSVVRIQVEFWFRLPATDILKFRLYLTPSSRSITI